ncbi:hypothetical protein Pse7367_1952 [Thalassoporum mexicanum PCC 7367]|uniref:hypothetical protein n=1 Tax=Thalassoporum mexicanum TaxID=3457544 RepID=UPI00029FA5DB|nr:hypothetical protein [Pseudanabaena sp. PCC 7367]AFY70227.1 hypothetical protein Pse7367_1952 [Pseudanabaena sp. PCC 7367]
MKFYRFGNSGSNPYGNGFGGLRFLITAFLVIWGLSAIGLGWLVNSIFILIGIITIAPIIALVGFQWWLKRSLVTADCPVCQFRATAAKGSEFNCPSCGEPLEAKDQQFVRLTPPGTIDVEVQAID